MALFYFHFLLESQRQNDEIGVDLPDVESAYLQAVATARSMAGELIAEGTNPAHCGFEVEDAKKRLMFAISFSELFGLRALRPRAMNGSTERWLVTLEDTQRRAVAAQSGMARSVAEARVALEESRALLGRLDAIAR